MRAAQWPFAFMLVGVTLNLVGQLTDSVPVLLVSIGLNLLAIGGFVRDIVR